MGRRKGKKGKTQNSRAGPSDSQQQGPQGSSRQQTSTGQPEQEGAEGSQMNKQEQQQKTLPSHDPSPTQPYAAQPVVPAVQMARDKPLYSTMLTQPSQPPPGKKGKTQDSRAGTSGSAGAGGSQKKKQERQKRDSWPALTQPSIPHQPPPVVPGAWDKLPSLTVSTQTSQPPPACSSKEPTSTTLSNVQISEIDTGHNLKGTKIEVETNHLSLNLGKLKTAVHYDVNLIPDKPKKLLRKVLDEFRIKHFKNRYPAFDGRKNLYSASLLPFDGSIEDEISILLPDGTNKIYKVEIKFAKNVDLTPLHDLINSPATPREALQVVDIVLRSAPASTCISAGRSFFIKPSEIVDLKEGMEMYTGFYQSAIRGSKPFLNVDVVHKAFPKHMQVHELIKLLFGGTTGPLQKKETAILNDFINTLRVCYKMPPQNSTRMYTVNGVATSPRHTTFKLGNAEITIENYFEIYKKHKLEYPNLPTLWVGSKSGDNKILLPVELCTIVESQVTNKKLTDNQTREMIQQTAQDTATRKIKILTSLRQANHNDDLSVRNEFKFSVGNEFTKVESRILNPPTLVYANDNYVTPRGDGTWTNSEFFKHMPMNKWTITCVDRVNARPEDLTNLTTMLKRIAESMQMEINQPEKPFIHIKPQTLAEIQDYFRRQKSKRYDVIFVIVPNSGPQYSYVKIAAEINVGCLTQCIKSRTILRMSALAVRNLLLKVNSKLNGINHYLGNKLDILKRPFMIMGADVTHPSSDARNIPSVAAVTASHDPKAFKYNICWRLQPPMVEIIEDLEAIVIEQLQFFKKQTNCNPEKIIFFKDGVSEGQFEQVRNSEIRAIRSACKKLQLKDPKITFLVVQKRHHTRFFPLNNKKESNVLPGTCVNSSITNPFMQDFYLVSHSSGRGVVRPTKYSTLWDDNSLTNDELEELTYYLCHMFSRCNRSVSYPAPTYYAHLAAARGKVYITKDRQIDMDTTYSQSQIKILDEIRKGKPMFFV